MMSYVGSLDGNGIFFVFPLKKHLLKLQGRRENERKNECEYLIGFCNGYTAYFNHISSVVFYMSNLASEQALLCLRVCFVKLFPHKHLPDTFYFTSGITFKELTTCKLEYVDY